MSPEFNAQSHFCHGLANMAQAGTTRCVNLSLVTTIPTRSDDVSVIDLRGRTEEARIPVGRGVKLITIGNMPVALADALRNGN